MSIQTQQIPAGWKVMNLSQICENLDNLRKPVTKTDREKGDIPYYGATGVVDHVSDYIFDETLLLLGEDAADWSPYANSAYVIHGKTWVNNHAHVLRCTQVNITFLKEYLNWSDLRIYTTGTTRGKLTKGALDTIKIPLPSSNEQSRIAAILLKVDEEIETVERIIKQTEKLKKGLMQKLLTKGIGHTKFKQTEFGEIPEEWEVLKIQDLIDQNWIEKNQDGNHGNSHPKSSDFVDGGIPFVTATEFSNGEINLKTCKFLTKEQADSLRIGFSYEGDVILTHKGTVGLTAIVPSLSTQYIMLSPQTTYYRCNTKKLCNKFLYYIFQSEYFQNLLKNRAKQSTRDYIGITNQRLLPLIVTKSLEEQRGISKILEGFDRKIEVNQKIKSSFLKLKKGLMNDLLSGKVRVNH